MGRAATPPAPTPASGGMLSGRRWWTLAHLSTHSAVRAWSGIRCQRKQTWQGRHRSERRPCLVRRRSRKIGRHPNAGLVRQQGRKLRRCMPRATSIRDMAEMYRGPSTTSRPHSTSKRHHTDPRHPFSDSALPSACHRTMVMMFLAPALMVAKWRGRNKNTNTNTNTNNTKNKNIYEQEEEKAYE